VTLGRGGLAIVGLRLIRRAYRWWLEVLIGGDIRVVAGQLFPFLSYSSANRQAGRPVKWITTDRSLGGRAPQLAGRPDQLAPAAAGLAQADSGIVPADSGIVPADSGIVPADFGLVGFRWCGQGELDLLEQ
jgi:hypothetical protein